MSSGPNDRHPAHATAGLGLSLRLGLFSGAFLIAAALALYALASYAVTRAVAGGEIEFLQERVQEYRAWFRDGGLQALGARFEEQAAATPEILFLRVVGRDGQAVFFSHPRGRTSLPPRVAADLQGLLSPQPGSVETRVRLGPRPEDSWTLAAAPLGPGLVIQSGKSARAAAATLRRFRHSFALASIPVVLGGVAGGIALTYRGLRPVRRLAATLRDILDTGELDRRAPAQPDDREMNSLVQLFNELLARNERLVRTTRDSLDSVAHELRTPMARLRAAAEEALQAPGDSPQTSALRDCLEESDQALTLLSRLTELAEAETGALRLTLENLDLRETTRKVLDLYEFVAEEKRVQLEADLPPGLGLRADAIRLQQVLSNLLDNAIKYAPPGSTVELSACAQGSGAVTFTVHNEGPGIPPEELPRIWDRLYRGSGSGTTRGLGLGLSLVRALVNAHHGTVSVDSAPGRGVTFTVRLPTEPS